MNISRYGIALHLDLLIVIIIGNLCLRQNLSHQF